MKLTVSGLLLKNKLDDHYNYFDRTKISPDPIEFPHRFNNPQDIEISAFISSLFAYGNVKQINNTLQKIHSIMEWMPYKFVYEYSANNNNVYFKNVYHRFYSSEDIHNLFVGMNRLLKSYSSIRGLFYSTIDNEFNLQKSIGLFSNKMIELCSSNKKTTRGIIFMFPNPQKGSACKRMNLFLRWMVRKDELDFGLWEEIPKDKLLIPVDVHIARICKQLKLTKKKNVSWKMAEEITEKLKKFDSEDPVKYDFAICHIGMRKLVF